MTARASFWSDVRWQAFGNTLAQAVGVLGMPLLTRLYSPADFAAQTVFLQFVMFFAGVMTCRFEYFVQLPKSDSEALGLMRLTWLLAAITCILLTPLTWLVTPLFSMDAGQVKWLWLSPLTAALISLSFAHQHWTQRQGQFKLSGAGEVVAKLAYVATGVVIAMMGGGAVGLIVTIAAAAAAKLLLHVMGGRASRKAARESSGTPRAMQAARRHAGHAVSMVGSHLLGTVTSMVPILFVGGFYGASTLGQYGLVTATIFLPAGLIGGAIGQVYYQRAAALWSGGASFAALWGETFKRLSLMGLPAYVLIAVLAPRAYPVIFGDAWHAAGEYAAWMSVAAFFSFITAPMDRSSLIVGRLRYLPVWHAARAISLLVVIALAWSLALPFQTFLVLLVLQMSALYAVDLMAERRFSRMHPLAPTTHEIAAASL